MEEVNWQKLYKDYRESSTTKRKMSMTRYISSIKKGHEKYVGLSEARRFGRRPLSMEEYAHERNRYYSMPLKGERNYPRLIATSDRYFSPKQERTLAEALRVAHSTIDTMTPAEKFDTIESIRTGAGISEELWDDIFNRRKYALTAAHESAAYALFRYLIGEEYGDYIYDEG